MTGLWVESAFGACKSTPIVCVNPCELTIEMYSRKSKGFTGSLSSSCLCPVCGVAAPIRSPTADVMTVQEERGGDGKASKKKRRRIGLGGKGSCMSVFIPLTAQREAVKRPYSRLCADPLTAVLALPTFLLRQSFSGQPRTQELFPRAILGATTDLFQPHLVDLCISRLNAFCEKSEGLSPGGTPFIIKYERWAVLLQIPVSILVLSLHPNRVSIMEKIDISTLRSTTLAEAVRRVDLLKGIVGDEVRVSDFAAILSATFDAAEVAAHGDNTGPFWEKPLDNITIPTLPEKVLQFNAFVVSCVDTVQAKEITLRHCNPSFDVLMEDATILQPQGLNNPVQFPLTEVQQRMIPKGFIYIQNFLKPDESDSILSAVAPSLQAGAGKGMQRRVAHFGFNYRYPADGIDVDNPHEGGMPVWCRSLATRVETALHIRKGGLTQMTVNEYEPGQGIASHFDDFETIGEPLVTVSLCTPTVMSLQDHSTGFKVDVVLEPNSVAMFTEDSRFKWTHGIPKRSLDPHPSGEGTVKRGVRVSATFRNVPPCSNWRAEGERES